MLYDDTEGSEGVRVGGRFKKEGIYAYLQLIHCWAAEPTPHCKVIIPQFYKALWKENQQDSVTDETVIHDDQKGLTTSRTASLMAQW